MSNIPEAVASLRGSGIRDTLARCAQWVEEHRIVVLVVAVIALIAGILFSRYISFGFGLALVGLGYAISRLDERADGYFYYVVGLVIFIIPYFW